MNKVNCRNPSLYDYAFISDCIFNDIGINDTCIMDYDFKHTTVEPLISFAVGTDMNSVFIVNKNGIFYKIYTSKLICFYFFTVFIVSNKSIFCPITTTTRPCCGTNYGKPRL